MRGRYAKPPELHVIDGTVNVTRQARKLDSPVATGAPVKPKGLKGRAAVLWDEYVVRAPWLKEADSQALFMWCCLSAEAERSVKNMAAPRISQWRGLTSQLGLDPASRTRLGKDGGPKKQDPAEGYFNFKPKAG